MTLTVEVPANVEQIKLQRAAVAMYDAHLLTQGQAAEMAGLSRPDFIEALIRSGISVIQYENAEAILAEADLLAAHS